MATFATVFTFNSSNDSDIALKKDTEPPVIYYGMSTSYYVFDDGTGYWSLLTDRPSFTKKKDTLIFYFIDSAQHVEQPGAELEFQQVISPFDDEIAAQIRLAAPVGTKFQTSEHVSQDAFMLPAADPPGSLPAEGDGYPLESAGKYDYTVTLITFPDQRKYYHDPEMDVEP